MFLSRRLSASWLLAMIFTIPLFAQSSIQGQVLDETAQPLGYAGVMLLSATDSVLVKGAVTNEDGQFLFEKVDPGHYLVGTSMIGYLETFSAPIQLATGQAPVVLPPIQLANAALNLETVEVTAERPLFEQRIDRLVVNVAESVTSAGSTALEILERSPGVIVNRQNGDIALSGKNGVIIMINNKVNQMPLAALVQLLESMPSDNIQKIELITTPPSNFDAEGNAGIINILLKKNLDEGLNGSASAILGYGVNEKYGGNTNFNYRQGALNFFGDYSYFRNHSYQVFENFRSVLADGVLLENDNISERDPFTTTQSLRLGADFQLSPQTVVGVLGSWSKRYWIMDAVNTVNTLENQTLQEQLIITNDEINDWRSYLANVNLQHTFGDDGRLTFDLDYARYINNNPSNYLNEYFSPDGQLDGSDQVRIDKDTPIDIYVVKTDYSQSLGQSLTLEAGAKGTLSRFDNDFRVDNLLNGAWMPDPVYTDSYRLDEKIGAVYSSLSWQITPQLGAKAGLRYEYTDSNLGAIEEPNIIDRRYGNFFPSLFLSYEIADGQQVNLSYSRRINRPAYTQLAPFVIFLDPTTLLSGNIGLQPALTDAYRLGYQWRSYFLQVEYSYEDQSIAGWQPTIDTNTGQQINRPINADFYKNLSISLTIPITLTDWWTLRLNTMAFWGQNQIQVEGQAVQNAAWTYGLNGFSSFQLPWQMTLEVSGNYMSPVAWGVMRSLARGDVNIGLQKKLGSQGNSLRLNVQNLFLGNNWLFSTDGVDLDFNVSGAYRFMERQVRLTYTHHFGNGQVKAARQRQTGSAAEQERVEQ
ncbi:MAG: TonB-dependent receptor [Lewinella sp.]|nr:TonB-dependent receptor [Lewinella sp.]